MKKSTVRLTRRGRVVVGGVVVTAALAVGLAGCSDKLTERYKDAERGSTNGEPADTITFPDGFSNAATKCDHGNRVYVLFHENDAYGSIAVVPNAKDCVQ